MKPKVKTIELDELTERWHAIVRALADERRTPGTLTADARRWLEMERKHYDEGGNLTTWAEKRARIEAAYALGASRVAEAEAAKAEARAADDAKAAEAEAALRAKLAQETDPLTVWRRSQAARTF
jgi:hypothetical protein